MDKYRDKELIELVDQVLAPLNPIVHKDYLYNVLTAKHSANKTVKEVLTEEISAMNKVPNTTGVRIMSEAKEVERKKDGNCHAHCQVGCDYKVYGKCLYNGDDGCEGQYIISK